MIEKDLGYFHEETEVYLTDVQTYVKTGRRKDGKKMAICQLCSVFLSILFFRKDVKTGRREDG